MREFQHLTGPAILQTSFDLVSSGSMKRSGAFVKALVTLVRVVDTTLPRCPHLVRSVRASTCWAEVLSLRHLRGGDDDDLRASDSGQRTDRWCPGAEWVAKARRHMRQHSRRICDTLLARDQGHPVGRYIVNSFADTRRMESNVVPAVALL